MTAAVLVRRIGGLAAVLGAGVVVGLAVSAPASAAPASTSSSAGSADNDARESSPRRPGAAARTDRVPAKALAPSVGDRPPSGKSTRVNAAAARAAVHQVASDRPGFANLAAPAGVINHEVHQNPLASAAVTVAPADVKIPGTVEAVQPVAAAPAVAPPAGNSLTSVLGDPRGRRITIVKGTHFAIPGSFRLLVRKAIGTGTFTADSVYNLNDEDQHDWNKFSGIAFTPLQPDRNSAMVGWRYNLSTGEFDIAPFFNVNKQRILPDEMTEVISVPADQTFEYSVDYTGVTISYADRTVVKPYPQGLTPNFWTSMRISGWFGGNEVAPRTVSYYLRLK